MNGSLLKNRGMNDEMMMMMMMMRQLSEKLEGGVIDSIY